MDELIIYIIAAVLYVGFKSYVSISTAIGKKNCLKNNPQVLNYKKTFDFNILSIIFCLSFLIVFIVYNYKNYMLYDFDDFDIKFAESFIIFVPIFFVGIVLINLVKFFCKIIFSKKFRCTEKIFVRYVKQKLKYKSKTFEFDCFTFNYHGDDYLILVNDSSIYLKEDVVYEMYINPNDISEYYINNPPKRY